MAQAFHDREEELLKAWDSKNKDIVTPLEVFWVEHQPWLEQRGYMLRPRYHPNWIPSWKLKATLTYPEDGIQMPASRCHLMDAIRISDGAHVGLKRIFKSEHPMEADITRLFSTGPLAMDPKNHCIPLLEILEVPEYEDMILLVLPYLSRYNVPPFITVGEAMEYFRQIFEALQFMHKHYVAHRDCTGNNIMMDGSKLYPKGFHPVKIWRRRDGRDWAKPRTRTEYPPRYYLVDFGLSRQYNPSDGPPLELPIRGADKSVPEFQGEGYHKASNPFPTDIYYLGNMIREDFIDYSLCFDFMLPLVNDMTQTEPSRRPTIDQVVTRFTSILGSLSNSQLRSRIIRREEFLFFRGCIKFVHFFRCAKFILLRIPPIPPSSRIAG